MKKVVFVIALYFIHSNYSMDFEHMKTCVTEFKYRSFILVEAWEANSVLHYQLIKFKDSEKCEFAMWDEEFKDISFEVPPAIQDFLMTRLRTYEEKKGIFGIFKR